MTQSPQEPQPGNGPFYVEPDCCLLCGVPEDIAPELFRTGDKSCYFIRQPSCQKETDKTITAMWAGEVDCIRYRGTDPKILRRLGEADLSHLADDRRAHDFPPVVRDRVVFSVREIPSQPPLESLAEAFRAYLRSQDRITVGRDRLRRRRVSFSWSGRMFHRVTFERGEVGGQYVAVLGPARRYALKGLARVVDEWLKDAVRAVALAWHSRASLRAGEAGSPNPF